MCKKIRLMDYLEVIGPETHSIISIQDGGHILRR
jgi:hypothetical protein